MNQAPPKSAQAAMAALVDPGAMLNAANRARIDGVSYADLCQPVAHFMRRFRQEMERYKIPFIVTESWRSPSRQIQLKQQGRSRAGPGSSPHQFGLAFDYVHATRFWALSPKEWECIGEIGKEISRKTNIPMTWGGDWKFYDPAHWEMRDWRKVADVMRAKRLDEAIRPRQEEWGDILTMSVPALARLRLPLL